MATAEDSVSTLDLRASAPAAPRPAPVTAAPAREPVPEAVTLARALPESHQQVAQDTAQMTMSTLSFQDYVRERMLRRRQTETPVDAKELGLRPAAAGTDTRFDAAQPQRRANRAASDCTKGRVQRGNAQRRRAQHRR